MRLLDQRGLGRLGCLLWLLVFSGIVYFGLPVGSAYFRYWQLLDEMKTQAQFAPSLDDVTIQGRLIQMVDDLDLPNAARRFTIQRYASPRQIVIRTRFSVTITYPFYSFPLHFSPEVVEPL